MQRRTEFITAAIVAAITVFALQAFVGPRYRGGWYGYQYRPWYYGAPGCTDHYRYDQHNMPRKDTAW